MPNYVITSEIENRLSAWQNYSQNKRPEATHPCITISREFGCEAYRVAKLLQEKLGHMGQPPHPWITLDRQLLERIAEESGISSTQLQYATQTSPLWASMRALFVKDATDPLQVFQYFKKAILHFAQEGHSVIIGRGGAFLTRHLPQSVHFRLVAPLEFRMQVLMQSQHLNEDQARAHIAEKQHQMNEFIQHFTNHSAADPVLYDLTLNNARNTPEQMTEIILDYMRMKNLLPQ